MSDMTAQHRAERAAAAMWANDRASQGMGMAIEAVRPGEATLSMTVTESMLNGHGTCHGGLITALADSAFAFACNSYNVITVAQSLSTTFLKPVPVGTQLRAEAREVARSGRSGVYDVDVRSDANEVVAVFRGQSRSLTGAHFEEGSDA